MTALNINTQIPSQIVTVEQLHIWSGSVLSAINPSLVVVEGVNYTERAAQNSPFWVAADQKWRQIVRLSLEMSPDWQGGGGKMWMYAQALSNTAIPTIYTQN